MNQSVKTLLPLYAKASAALAREAAYAGVLPLAKLERLSAALTEPTGELDVALKIRRDIGGAPKLEGRVCGNLQLVCQRCLRPFAWPLDIGIELRLVFNEEEETRVLKIAEPYRVIDDRLPFHPIVEEEVLLALPLAPRCTLDDCQTGHG